MINYTVHICFDSGTLEIDKLLVCHSVAGKIQAFLLSDLSPKIQDRLPFA